MLGKLMKYELRSMLRLFVPLWAAILLVSLLNRFTLRVDALSQLFHGVPAVLLMIIYVIGVLALILVALAFMIQRFYSGLLKDEGYLMFTLPVKSSALIWAKGLTATIVVTVTGLVCAASICVMVLDGAVLQELSQVMQKLRSTVDHFGGVLTLGIVLSVVLGIASVVKLVMQAYLAMAIGQLGNKHRVLLSVLAFLGITVVITTLASTLLASANWSTWFQNLMNTLMEHPENFTVAGTIWLAFGFLIVITVVQVVIFYFPAQIILQHKLNLE